ncbi:SRPBCC family protein [Brachybacterium sp. J144]|uniref:SRPBCC family protein n=1 Tax=Brachybacterium sp. J144 TaxID=3116487 RepID=UPI002E7725D3|nr:SRPBCC family protein [Brachybacterium sp. J144]MEE1651467.1 SRPBCC family protein [Brachybacterium sp. J144]
MSTLRTASREIAAPAAALFELIADPSQQPRWDGNGNLAEAPEGQRVTAVGDVFTMRNTSGKQKDNHVTRFVEGREIAWLTAPAGEEPPGHEWIWQLEPLAEDRTLVTHSYDFSRLVDEARIARSSRTTSEMLAASIENLAALAEGR